MNRDPIRRLEASVADLTEICIADFEAGSALAQVEVRALSELAEAIGAGLCDWRDRTATLALARPLDPRRAGVLVLESVFDEVLAPPAWRVLSDALALVDME